MSLFTLVSDGVPLSCGAFDEVTKAAAQERQAGHRVQVHRASAAERTLISRREWAVRIYAAGESDVLHCLDREDAVTTLHAVRSNGLRAEIVRL